MAFRLGDRNIVLLRDLQDFRRESMHELRPELDGTIESGVVLSENSSADAVAGLKNRDAKAGTGQFEGRGNSRDTRADDENVGIGHRSLDARGLTGESSLAVRSWRLSLAGCDRSSFPYNQNPQALRCVPSCAHTCPSRAAT